MLVLSVENKPVDTDRMKVGETVHNSVLSFQDYQHPDFYFHVIEFLDEFSSASITLKIGEYEVVMPLHWQILCTDMEYVQSIPLTEVGGKLPPVFCLNPIDGFAPEFRPLRTGTIFPQNTWTAPQLNDKDLVTVPLSRPGIPEQGPKGPLCAFFAASKFEVYKPIADIW